MRHDKSNKDLERKQDINMPGSSQESLRDSERTSRSGNLGSSSGSQSGSSNVGSSDLGSSDLGSTERERNR